MWLTTKRRSNIIFVWFLPWNVLFAGNWQQRECYKACGDFVREEITAAAFCRKCNDALSPLVKSVYYWQAGLAHSHDVDCKLLKLWIINCWVEAVNVPHFSLACHGMTYALVTKFRLCSHRHEYESAFPFMAVEASLVRVQNALVQAHNLNACWPYWIKSNWGNALRINNNILPQSYFFYKTAHL